MSVPDITSLTGKPAALREAAARRAAGLASDRTSELLGHLLVGSHSSPELRRLLLASARNAATPPSSTAPTTSTTASSHKSGVRQTVN